MNGSVADLLDSAESARHRELSRAARTLHDEAGQHLTALGLQLDLLELDFPEVSPSLAALRPLLEAAFQSVRSLSYDLNPDLAARVGLRAALEGAARRARCGFETDSGAAAIPAQQAAALFRIAECAIDNVMCYAGASRVTLCFKSGPPASLEIAGDSVGFDSDSSAACYGVSLIHHLAASNGYSASVRSEPGKGTIWFISAVSGDTRDDL